MFAYSARVYRPLPLFAVTVLVPICRMKSFSYDSMWDSRCVDVFSEREVSQRHTQHGSRQTLNTVVHVSASETINSLLPLAVQQH